MILFSDGTLRRDYDFCRERMNEARFCYTEDPSQENRKDYLRILKSFSELAMGKKPSLERIVALGSGL